MRAIPQIAVDFVAAHEGMRTDAYPDSSGVATIGYGHTDGVKLGDTCTRDQALAWLTADMQIAQAKLYGVIKPDIIETCLDDQQWAALLSFAYNLGAGKDWTIWKLINAQQFDQAADQLSRFIYSGGQKVQGLVNRRADEFKLWHSGSAPVAAVPSVVTREPGMTPPTPTAAPPLAQSKTIWAAGAVVAAGVVQGAQYVQQVATPQAATNPWLAKLVGLSAAVIVAGGVAITVFKALEQRNKYL